jgi:hypothetical protein
LLENEAQLVRQASSAVSSPAAVDTAALNRGEPCGISGSDFTLQIIGAGHGPALLLMYPLSKPMTDTAPILSSVAQGHPDHAVLQAVDAALKDGEGLVNRVLRCVTTALLIHVMPTSVIGHTISMLSDAVRGMREAAEARERASVEAGRGPVPAAELSSWASARDAARDRVRRPDETVPAAPERPGGPTAPDARVPHSGSDGPTSRKWRHADPSDKPTAPPGEEQLMRPSVGSPSSPTSPTVRRPTRPSGPSHPGQGGRL